MSLINQVLQDLDRRRADQAALPLAAQRVAPVAVAARPRLLAGALGAALIAVAAAAAAALIWRQVDARPLATALTTAAPAPAIAATTSPPTAGASIDFGAAAKAEHSTFASALPGDANAAVIDFPAAVTAAAPARADAAASVALAETAPAKAAAPANAATAAPPGTVPPVSLQASIAAPARVEKITPPLSPAEHAEAEYRRGIELHERGRSDDAEAAFAAALQLDGRHAPARQALAVAWTGRGRLDDAERLLREGLAQNPRQPPLAIVLARLQAERRDLPGAVETLRAALGAGAAPAAEQAEARALIATLQQSAGQHREAIDAYSAALRQAPQNGAWWIGLGLSLAAEGRAESASEAFERARATGTLAPELLLYVEQRLRAPTP